VRDERAPEVDAFAPRTHERKLEGCAHPGS
jgi:hypothetical protein